MSVWEICNILKSELIDEYKKDDVKEYLNKIRYDLDAKAKEKSNLLRREYGKNNRKN